jgi:large subunit ribosomal protein L31
MKTDIHPTIHTNATVHCSCGASFNLPGTVKEQHIEICSQCHPFYTGKVKVIDTAGRIDKFKAKQAKAQK